MSNATHTADAGTDVTAQAIDNVQDCTTMAEVRAACVM
jgi:hypothetical protein